MEAAKPGKLPGAPARQAGAAGKAVRPGPPLANEILGRLRATRISPIQNKPTRPGPPLASEILGRFHALPPVQQKSVNSGLQPAQLPGPPLASAILARFQSSSRKAAQRKTQHAGNNVHPPLASEILSRFRCGSGSQHPIQQKNLISPGTRGAQLCTAVIQRMQDDEMDWTEQDAMERLHRARERNLEEKSEPLGKRDIFDVQSQSSYGYTHTNINYGGKTASFRKGWGNQPFLSGGVDYDSIVSEIEKSGILQFHVAEAIIAKIDDKSSGYMEELAKDNPGLLKAMQELIVLTQIIESHDTRAPGWDKVARSLLIGIVEGRHNFKQCFNRVNGLFLPAWRKKAGAICGGQEAVRAFMSLVRKKNDKRQIDDGMIVSLAPYLYEEIQAMSDSSDEEGRL